MKFANTTLALGLLGAGMALGTNAHAIVAMPPQTFVISLDCADCAALANTSSYPVQAELTLSNYTLGDTLDITNFVSFTYDGSNLVDAYSITDSGDDNNGATINDFFTSSIYVFSGVISTVPGANTLDITFDDGLHFRTQTDGSWSTCAPNANGYYGGNSCFQILNADYGSDAIYSTTPVPEPSHLALMAAGLVLVASAVRRHQRN